MGYAIAAFAVLALLLLANPKAAGALSASVSGLIPKSTPNLYTLTDADVEQIVAPYSDSRSTFNVHGQTLGYWIRQAVRSRRFSGYTYGPDAPSCQGLISGPGTYQIGSGLGNAALQTAGTFAKAGSTLAKSIPVVGTIIGFGEAIFGFLSAHHAAAVREENSVLCNAWPAANMVLNTIDSNMQTGTWNGQQVEAELDNLQTEIEKDLSVIPNSGAADVMSQQWNAIVKAFQLVIAKSGI